MKRILPDIGSREHSPRERTLRQNYPLEFRSGQQRTRLVSAFSPTAAQKLTCQLQRLQKQLFA